jgi:hypothetical protein
LQNKEIPTNWQVTYWLKKEVGWDSVKLTMMLQSILCNERKKQLKLPKPFKTKNKLLEFLKSQSMYSKVDETI